MNKNFVSVVVASSMVLLPACARRVVLDPEVALQKNSADWTVKSEPRKAPEISEPQAAAAPSKAPKAAEKNGTRKAKRKR